MDLNIINKEIENFKEAADGFIKNEELTTLAKDMQRCFCVLVI